MFDDDDNPFVDKEALEKKKAELRRRLQSHCHSISLIPFFDLSVRLSMLTEYLRVDNPRHFALAFYHNIKKYPMFVRYVREVFNHYATVSDVKHDLLRKLKQRRKNSAEDF